MTTTPAPYSAIASGPEALTCWEYVVPALTAVGWYADPHSVTEQKTFTDGRILVRHHTVRRLPQKRADYLLSYTPDFPLAVVEAKAAYKLPADGLQQAKDYAQVLGLSFAYATNGHGIVEHDYTTGLRAVLDPHLSDPSQYPAFTSTTPSSGAPLPNRRTFSHKNSR